MNELDDVQQRSGDGGEGISDFYRSLESRDEEANTREGQATIPCELCGRPTNMLGTKRCDRCWELETRIEMAPEIARSILRRLSPEIDEVERNRREDEKERIEKEWYENERSRAATADYEFEIEEDLE